MTGKPRPAGPVAARFGENVQAVRERRGISRADLAQRLGIAKTGVGEIELGKRNVSLDQAVDIAAALGVGLPYLLRDRSVWR